MTEEIRRDPLVVAMIKEGHLARKTAGNDFILKTSIVGSPYITQGIQKLAGQKVEPLGFAYRKMADRKEVLVKLSPRDYLPLTCFYRHPPEGSIRMWDALMISC